MRHWGTEYEIKQPTGFVSKKRDHLVTRKLTWWAVSMFWTLSLLNPKLNIIPTTFWTLSLLHIPIWPPWSGQFSKMNIIPTGVSDPSQKWTLSLLATLNQPKPLYIVVCKSRNQHIGVIPTDQLGRSSQVPLAECSWQIQKKMQKKWRSGAHSLVRMLPGTSMRRSDTITACPLYDI